MNFAYFFLGTVLLYIGGEIIVSNAANLAKNMGISSLVIGVVVVGFCTSIPELVVGIISQYFRKMGDVALGSAIGSNIANISAIVGSISLIWPLKNISKNTRKEGFLMILSTVILSIAMIGYEISRTKAIFMLFFMVFYLLYQRQIAHENSNPSQNHRKRAINSHPTWMIVKILLGGTISAIGGDIFITGAMGITDMMGLSQRFLGIVIASLGTSLPEFVTSLIAMSKKNVDLFIGNIIGSNIFNALLIVSITALISPIKFSEQLLSCDIPFLFLTNIIFVIGLRFKIALLSLPILYIFYVYILTN